MLENVHQSYSSWLIDRLLTDTTISLPEGSSYHLCADTPEQAIVTEALTDIVSLCLNTSLKRPSYLFSLVEYSLACSGQAPPLEV